MKYTKSIETKDFSAKPIETTELKTTYAKLAALLNLQTKQVETKKTMLKGGSIVERGNYA